MRRQGRIRAAVALAVLAMAASACAASNGSVASSGGGGGKSYTIRLGLLLADSDPTSQSMATFKKIVEDKSGGRLKVNIFGNGQLGGAQSLFDQVKSGSLQMSLAAPDYAAKYYPPIQLFSLPFLFPDRQHAYSTVDGSVGQEVASKLSAASGLKILNWEDFGFRSFANDKHPINTPADVKGLKLRVLPSPISVATFKALGINGVAIDYSEVYTGVQQGTLDGADSPNTVLLSSKLYEVAKYISETDHQMTFAITVINQKFFDSLPSDLQSIITDAAAQAQSQERQVSTQGADQAAQKMVQLGAKYNKVSPANRALFEQAVQPVYAEFEQKLGPDAKNWIETILASDKNG